jgi:hypothetical protein
MAASPNTVATLNGLFKTVYGDSVENLIPDGVMLLNMVPMIPAAQRLGKDFRFPVIVAQEHGFSYGGTEGLAFDLADPIAGQVREAVVESYEFVLRTSLSVGSVSRSINDKAAFERATKLVVANMVRSFAKRLEAIMFYGQKNIGIVNANPAGAVLVISAASWAAGLWSGGVNMEIDIFDATGATKRGTFKISAIDIETRSLTTSSTPNFNVAGVVATDVIVHKGAGLNAGSTIEPSLEFPGLQRIMENTGTLFNINATTYDLWKATQYSAAGADLSFLKIQKAIALAVAKGLDEDVVCLVSPATWAKLLSDQAALRMYDDSYKTEMTETGSKAIKFYGQNGAIEIRSCTYVKESLAFIFPKKDALMRVGSTDVTFKRPGYADEFFRELDGQNGYELRAYCDQSLMSPAPSKLLLINNIVNT